MNPKNAFADKSIVKGLDATSEFGESRSNYINWSLNAKEIHRTSHFKLLEKDDFQVVEYHSPQVIILPVVNHTGIVLCKVFRKPLGQAIWELPAGGVVNGETIEGGALREFREETGVQIFDESRLTPLSSFIVSPNRLPMFPAIFQLQLTHEDFVDRLPHDDEIETVELYPISVVKKMINSNEIFSTIPLSILCRFILAE